MKLHLLGWCNLILSSFIVGWYAIDGFNTRKSLYHLFGFEEPIIQFEIRFWRKLVLLASAVLAVSSALIALTPEKNSPPGYYQTLVALAGVFVAALGWMLTAFEREKADRIKNTLDAIRHQLYDKEMVAVHDSLITMTAAAREAAHVDNTMPVPLNTMEQEIKSGDQSIKLHNQLIKFLNSLDQVALGVRSGHYDFTTVMLVLRARYLRFAFSYTPYIMQQTGASVSLVRDNRLQFVGGNKSWEHFRWLVAYLDASDIPLGNLRTQDTASA